MQTLTSVPPASRLIRVAIVDDQPAHRAMLCHLLKKAPGLEFIGAYATGEAALRFLPLLQPEVVIMDLNIARSIDGTFCTRELRRLMPQIDVIIHTMVTDRTRIKDALRAGAVGYILKSEPDEVLLKAIHEAVAGGAPLSSAISRAVVECFQSSEEFSSIELLTSREMEVLSATSNGARNKELATRFGVSPDTIRNHLRRIFGKLRVNSRTEAAALYWSKYANGLHLSVVAA